MGTIPLRYERSWPTIGEFTITARYLTTGDVARLCDVTSNGVIKWINSGKLKAFRTPGGQRRIRHEDFVEFLSRFNYPSHDTLAAKTSSQRVLLIDDDLDITHLIKVYLTQRSGTQLVTANNGYDAFLKVGTYHPDLILLDMLMPGMNGFEVFHELKRNEASRDIPVIIISSLNPQQVIDRLGDTVVILSKPINLKELGVAINQALQARQTG